MPRKSNTRAAQGSGTIRRRKDGTWEGRFTIGRDPGTGKQVQKSVYGKTQAEVRKKMTAVTSEIDKGIYTEFSKMTVGQWLDIWLADYIGDVSEHTIAAYEQKIRVHIKPCLGAVRLSMLKPHQIQAFYNDLERREEKPLKPKSIKNINGVLHRALNQALQLGYIRSNPCEATQLPRVIKKDIRPLQDAEIAAFLSVLEGDRYQTICKVDIFTGMRVGEIIGLTWDRVDFKKGTILIDRQMIVEKKKGGAYKFAATKNGKERRLTPAPAVMALLQARKKEQAADRLKAGNLWNEGDFSGLVFTNEFGKRYSFATMTEMAKRTAQKIGIEGFRFHDLRHTYAVASIRAGDDIKTISSNLGHATVAFTMDVYAHYTDDMRKASAARMEAFMQEIGV